MIAWTNVDFCGMILVMGGKGSIIAKKDAYSMEQQEKKKVGFLRRNWLLVLNVALLPVIALGGTLLPVWLIIWVMVFTVLIVKFFRERRINAVILLVLFIAFLTHQIYWMPRVVEARLLCQMPLGSSREEVMEFVQERWIVQHENWIIEDATRRHMGITNENATNGIGVFMGTHRSITMFILRTDTGVFWFFDDDGYLVEIVARWSLQI